MMLPSRLGCLLSLKTANMGNPGLDSMPAEVHALASEQPITVDKMRQLLANKTAARFSDLDKTVLDLVREREFDILGPDGKARSRKLARLRPTDRIAIPSQRLFPGLSRRES